MREAAARPSDDACAEPGLSAAVMATLVENHARFLAFLERRLGDRALAEEILQDAFVRGMDRGGSLRDGESAVAWFYRVLRNAAIDHARHAGAEQRALAAVAAEPPASPEDDIDQALREAICACVSGLVPTLKPDYAHALRRVDLEGASVTSFAAEAGINAGNAAVRLHRARQALRRRVEQSCGTCAEHGCFDCQCVASHVGAAR